MLSDIIANMAAQCTRGTNSDFTTTDRGTILEQLKLLADEVYALPGRAALGPESVSFKRKCRA